MIFLTVCVDEGLSNLRSSSKDNRESEDLPKSPRVLIDNNKNNFHFNNISITYNYTSHYLRQCTIGCHSGTKMKKNRESEDL